MKRLWILSLIGVTSCAPVYVPMTRNAPMFSKAREFQGTIAYGSGDLELMGALSLTNHLAILGNYSYGNRNTDSLKQQGYHKHDFREGAIGYFYNEKRFGFEIFAGYGKGNAASFSSTWASFLNQERGSYTRYFVQPSFSFSRNFFQMAVTPRFSSVQFTEFTNSSGVTYHNGSAKMFFEPAFTARFNFADNRIFAMLQGGVSVPIDGNLPYDYEPITITTGLGFRLGGTHLETKEK